MTGALSLWWDAMGDASVAASVAVIAVYAATRLWRGMPPAAACWLWRLACAQVVLSVVASGTLELAWLPAAPAPPVSAAVFSLDAIAAPAAPAVSPEVAGPPAWLLIAFGLWCAGVALGVARLAVQLARTRRTRRAARRVTVVDGVAVYEAPVEAPALLGLWRPMVAVPVGMHASATREELAAVVAHELAHRRRRDLLWSWIPTAAGALMFFHPLVWLARAEHRVTQEIATDARVLASGGVRAGAYARTLLSLANVAPRDHAPAAGAAGHLRRRLAAIAAARPSSRAARGTAVALVALAGVLVLPWRLTARPGDPTAFVIASPDGALVVDVGHASVSVSDAETGASLWRVELPVDVSAVAFSADAGVLAAGFRDRAARVWVARTGEPIATLSGHAGEVSAVAVSADGGHVAVAYRDRVTIWNLASGAPTLLGPVSDSIARLSFASDGAGVIAETGAGERHRLVLPAAVLAASGSVTAR